MYTNIYIKKVGILECDDKRVYIYNGYLVRGEKIRCIAWKKKKEKNYPLGESEVLLFILLHVVYTRRVRVARYMIDR